MMKRMLAILVVIGFGIFLSVSNAFAINLGTLVNNDLRFQFQNWDVATLWSSSGVGLADNKADSFALLEVTNINKLSGGVLWSETPLDALTGILYGIDDNNVAVSGSSIDIDSIGGYVDIYSKPFTLNTTAANAPSMPMADLNAPTDLWGATGTPGQLFLRLQFVPGVNIALSDLTTTFHVDQTNTVTPISGSSSGYLKVIGGSAASTFDSNAFASIYPDADFYFIDNFYTSYLTADEKTKGWIAGSGGNAFGSAVPEPSTMLMFGMGMFGLATRVIRRKKVA